MISNALPIQFWPTGTETFNELDVCGITAICFCQPVQCTDEITIQFEDTTGQTLFLIGVNADDEPFINEPFVEILSGLYQVTFNPTEACGEVIQFLISGANVLTNPDFTSNITGWLNTGVAGAFAWSANHSGSAFAAVSIGPSDHDNQFYQTISPLGTSDDLIVETEIVFESSQRNSGSLTISLVSFTNTGVVVDVLETITMDATTPNINGTYSISKQYTPTSAINRIGIVLDQSAATSGLQVDIYVKYIYLKHQEASGYRTDCIDVAEEHECTKLITYSNNSDFAGIVYEGISPVPEFHLRVPAILFRATRPEEQEVHPLSNDEWIRVWSRMTKKMRLELGFMPDYMHEKLQLIFMHDNVEIDGLSWKKRDPYELIEGNPENPLMKANVLLTDKTFIKRNLI